MNVIQLLNDMHEDIYVKMKDSGETAIVYGDNAYTVACIEAMQKDVAYAIAVLENRRDKAENDKAYQDCQDAMSYLGHEE